MTKEIMPRWAIRIIARELGISETDIQIQIRGGHLPPEIKLEIYRLVEEVMMWVEGEYAERDLDVSVVNDEILRPMR